MGRYGSFQLTYSTPLPKLKEATQLELAKESNDVPSHPPHKSH
jgi:hypothetical protein